MRTLALARLGSLVLGTCLLAGLIGEATAFADGGGTQIVNSASASYDDAAAHVYATTFERRRRGSSEPFRDCGLAKGNIRESGDRRGRRRIDCYARFFNQQRLQYFRQLSDRSIDRRFAERHCDCVGDAERSGANVDKRRGIAARPSRRFHRGARDDFNGRFSRGCRRAGADPGAYDRSRDRQRARIRQRSAIHRRCRRAVVDRQGRCRHADRQDRQPDFAPASTTRQHAHV